MINENFVILGALINLLGSFSYLRDMFRGKAKPNRVSWGLWSLAVMIAFAAEVKSGVGIRALTTFMIGFSPLLIFIASFFIKKAYWAITKFDLACGVLSLLALIMWYFTKNANVAISFAILADLIAGIPTIIKAYHHPETENSVEYSTSLISIVILMLTLKNFDFAFLAFPLYIFCYDSIVFTLINIRPHQLNKTKAV
jgi:hypothetical protein